LRFEILDVCHSRALHALVDLDWGNLERIEIMLSTHWGKKIEKEEKR